MGAGANIPFFLSLGSKVEYFGVEGSPSIVETVKRRFPGIKDRLLCADFCESLPFYEPFDIIIDRGATTHNSTESIQSCLKQAFHLLKDGGRYVGIDWFSTESDDFRKGTPLSGDPFSRTDYKNGPLEGTGIVHFSDEKHIKELFVQFKVPVLQHKLVSTTMANERYHLAAWNIIAEK